MATTPREPTLSWIDTAYQLQCSAIALLVLYNRLSHSLGTLPPESKKMATEAEQLAEIKALVMGVGPKEVRTPNMTVIAHDPKQIQQLLDRRASVAPCMCSIGGCVGVPKAAAYRGFTASYDPSVD